MIEPFKTSTHSLSNNDESVPHIFLKTNATDKLATKFLTFRMSSESFATLQASRREMNGKQKENTTNTHKGKYTKDKAIRSENIHIYRFLLLCVFSVSSS